MRAPYRRRGDRRRIAASPWNSPPRTRRAADLELIGEGLTNRQIGEQIFLAEKTVKNYVSNLLAKMGMSRRAEAAAYVARLEERKSRNWHE